MKILPKRKSIRLKNYDYSSTGYYYVTICTQNRRPLFGEIVNGKMILNDVGGMVNQWWLKIPNRFADIELDEYQIMPNHLHGIIVINDYEYVGVNPCVDPSNNQQSTPKNGRTHRSAPTIGLPSIIQWFKTMTTNYYIRRVKNHQWKPFHKRLWQRNYYEHVIKNEKDLDQIREYISNNPRMWYRDRNNPKNWGK